MKIIGAENVSGNAWVLHVDKDPTETLMRCDEIETAQPDSHSRFSGWLLVLKLGRSERVPGWIQAESHGGNVPNVGDLVFRRSHCTCTCHR